MSLEKVNKTISVLEKHNQWRRGAEIPMGNITELGEAIDYAVEILKLVKENLSHLENSRKNT